MSRQEQRKGEGVASRKWLDVGRALRHRNFARLLVGQAVSGAGNWAYNVALAVYVFDLTHSVAWVGAAYVGRLIPSLVFSPYSGVLADRFERVRLLFAADLLALLWMGLLAVLAAMHGPAIGAIVLAALTSTSQIVYKPATSAMTPQLVPESELAAANSLLSSVDSLVIIVGPAIGALMLLAGPPPVVFALNAATFGFSAWAVIGIRDRSRPAATKGVNPLAQIAAGFRAIAGSIDSATLVGLSVLTSFIYGTDTVLFVAVSQGRLHTGPTGYGYLLTALGVGGLMATPVAGWIAKSPRLALVLIGGMVVYCLPTAALVWTTSSELAFGIQVVRGFATFVVDVLVITELQRSVPDDLIARVFGIFWALVLGAIALGAIVAPALISFAGLDATLLLAAFVVPVVSAAMYPVLNAMDARSRAKVAALEPRVIALQKLGIFVSAPRPTLEKLADACDEVTAPAGNVLVREGEPADAFYVLLDGEAEVSAKGEASEERRIRTLGSGDYFGEIGLLESIPRTATVTALTTCRLYRIDGAAFLDALTNTAATTAFLANARAGLALTNPHLRPSGGHLGTAPAAAPAVP
jgi:MFS family permease